MRPIENDGKCDKSSLQSRDGLDEEEEKMCAWRHGPAALWYEMMGVDDDGTNLDYGFKLANQVFKFQSKQFSQTNIKGLTCYTHRYPSKYCQSRTLRHCLSLL